MNNSLKNLKFATKTNNFHQIHRLISNESSVKQIQTNRAKWDSVVKEAERAVGYPTSFLSLRWILNDEVANMASHIRKLLGTNHPLLKTAKNLLLRNELPTWGLIVLLISKTAGLNSTFSEQECDKTADILHSQRVLAEVTEMIKTSHLMHKGLINIDPKTEDASDLTFGNKLALLSGDYLLSISFHEVARLRNSYVQELMSSTLIDLVESDFLDTDNKGIPSKPLPLQKDIEIPLQIGMKPYEINTILGHMKAEWILRNILRGGNLLGKSCQCSLILANHDQALQEIGFNFGRHLALTWQLCLEIEQLKQEETFSLTSAPVMFHLEYEPEFHEQIVGDQLNFDFIREKLLAGPGLERSYKLQRHFSQMSLNLLSKFANSESKTALINIIESIDNSVEEMK